MIARFVTDWGPSENVFLMVFLNISSEYSTRGTGTLVPAGTGTSEPTPTCKSDPKHYVREFYGIESGYKPHILRENKPYAY